MKRLLLSALAVACLGIVSCKKEYTCNCTTVDTDPNFSLSGTSSITFTAKKKDAEAICSANESTVTSGAYSITTTCELD